MGALLTNPAVLLLLLWGASELARRWLVGRGAPAIPSGAIVMAGGIFVIAALGQLGLPPILGRLAALELLVVWGYLAYGYARMAWRGELGGSVRRRPMMAFAVGTWVAGSAVLGRALIEVLPGWQPVGFVLWVIAVAVWVWYLGLLPAAFRAAANVSEGYRANGAVLLPTVATQSLVVAGSALVPGLMPRPVAAALILLGYLFYAAGLVLILRRYLARSDWTVADGWENTNCIVHGAMSITGLAIVVSGALPPVWAVATWAWVVATFVVVEAVEAVRAVVRARAYGARGGAFGYFASQWSRNFTFGMFYAFTLQLNRSPAAPDGWAAGLQGVILNYGHYAVLAFLVAEIFVFFYDRTGAAFSRAKAAES